MSQPRNISFVQSSIHLEYWDNAINNHDLLEANNMQLDTFVARTSGLLSRIAASANFSFQSDHDWATFNRALVSWLKDPESRLPNDGHIIGLCCSTLLSIQFPDECRGRNDLIPEFRSFVLAASLAHRQRRNNKGTRRQVYPPRHESRSHLIRRLDGILTAQYLSSLSAESCQVLFHLVLGAVVGMGQTPSSSTTTTATFKPFSPSSSSAPPNLLSSEFQQSPTLWLSTKSQLAHTLARDLIALGSNKLGIKHLAGTTTDLEKLIITSAMSRWNEMESRVWVDSIVAADEKAPTSSTGASQEPTQQQPPTSSSPTALSNSTSKKRRQPSSSSTVTVTDDLDQDRNPPYWDEDPPPTPPPPTVEPTLIPVMLPYRHDHFQFQQASAAPSWPPNSQSPPSSSSAWSENPASYMEMTDEPESYYLATANENNKRGRVAAGAAAGAAAVPPVTATATATATGTTGTETGTMGTGMGTGTGTGMQPRSMTEPFPMGSPSDGKLFFVSSLPLCLSRSFHKGSGKEFLC